MLNQNRKFPLRKYPDFFISAKRVHAKYFTAWVQPADKLRVGVIVPKKSAVKATDRNQIKRKCYQAWEEVFAEYKSLPQIVVLTIRPSARQASVEELTQDLQTVLKKIASKQNAPTDV